MSDTYRPRLDAFYDMPDLGYLSARARETTARLEAETDPDRRDSLIKSLNSLTDE